MIKKITLSEKSIYFGNVKMPKNFEIDKEKLTENIFNSNYYENLLFILSANFLFFITFLSDIYIIGALLILSSTSLLK